MDEGTVDETTEAVYMLFVPIVADAATSGAQEHLVEDSGTTESTEEIDRSALENTIYLPVVSK
ncbi:MAG: hypothetical protein R2867_08040 [Caldilineaceae bacterium]